MGIVRNVNVDRIKDRAKLHGITMSYLSASIGKYSNFLSAVRLGTDRIDEDELAIIADKIHTTTAYLTGQTDDPEPPAAGETPEQLGPAKAELIRRVQSMSDDEVRRVAEIVDFVLSKRGQK